MEGCQVHPLLAFVVNFFDFPFLGVTFLVAHKTSGVLRWIKWWEEGRRWREYRLVLTRLDPVSCYAIYPCQLFEGWLTVCNSERQNVNGWNERKSLTGQHQAVLTRLDPVCPATQFPFLAIAKLFHPECGSITPKQYFLKERKMAKAKTFHPECRLDYSSAIGVFCHCQWQIRGRLVQISQCIAGNVLSADFQLPSPILPNPPAPKTKSNATQLT